MLSDNDFLTQMITLHNSIVKLCRQYVMDNPDGELEEFVEEHIEEAAGDIALMQLWLDVGEDADSGYMMGQ